MTRIVTTPDGQDFGATRVGRTQGAPISWLDDTPAAVYQDRLTRTSKTDWRCVLMGKRSDLQRDRHYRVEHGGSSFAMSEPVRTPVCSSDHSVWTVSPED